MSIQKLHTGRYYVRWNEGGKKRGRTFDRRRDAEKFEAEVRRRKAMGGLVIIPERITLSQLHERYIAFLKDKGREKNTMDGYAAMWKHLDKELGHAPVHEITPATVEALGPKMIRKGVGATSACKALGMLSAMMNRAIVWGYIDRNPCEHVERPKVTRKRKIVLSPSEVEKIRSKMSHRDRTLVSVLSLSGLRPGEALALRWGDISDRTIRVDKAVAHGVVKSTKNEKDRSVRLLPSLKQDLLEELASRERRIAPGGCTADGAYDRGSDLDLRTRDRRVPWRRSDRSRDHRGDRQGTRELSREDGLRSPVGPSAVARLTRAQIAPDSQALALSRKPSKCELFIRDGCNGNCCLPLLVMKGSPVRVRASASLSKPVSRHSRCLVSALASRSAS